MCDDGDFAVGARSNGDLGRGCLSPGIGDLLRGGIEEGTFKLCPFVVLLVRLRGVVVDLGGGCGGVSIGEPGRERGKGDSDRR